jgi:hypothetical protein
VVVVVVVVAVVAQIGDNDMSEAVERAMEAGEDLGLDNAAVIRLVDLIVDRSIAADRL